MKPAPVTAPVDGRSASWTVGTEGIGRCDRLLCSVGAHRPIIASAGQHNATSSKESTASSGSPVPQVTETVTRLWLSRVLNDQVE